MDPDVKVIQRAYDLDLDHSEREMRLERGVIRLRGPELLLCFVKVNFFVYIAVRNICVKVYNVIHICFVRNVNLTLTV